MSSTKATMVREVYSAIIIDVQRDLPIDTVAAFRDVEKISKVISTRGLGLVLIDFPDMGKQLDKALSRGYLLRDDLPPVFRSCPSKGYFSWLMSHIFDQDGCIREHIDPLVVFYARTLLYAFKKVKEDYPDETRDRAVDAFFSINNSTRRPSYNWSDDHLWMDTEPRRLSFLEESRPENEHLARILDEVSGRVISQFPLVDLQDLRPKHGPGAVADKISHDKYRFACWSQKLERVFPFDVFGTLSYDSFAERQFEPARRDHPAKLIAVPKTYKGPRLIASEPTAHMYCQQSVLGYIREYLPYSLRTCIDFLSQEPSRREALKASFDGELASVDLSSASDRLSCWTVERAFQYNHDLLQLLHASRSTRVVDATGAGFGEHQLLMYAPQGNATTFPVQSIVYAMCCITAVLVTRMDSKVSMENIALAARSVRVFGDDLLLPNDCVGHLRTLLDHLGLVVNEYKTHDAGFFRESCGMDAYKGYDVTPWYASHWLEDLMGAEKIISLVAIANNAFRKGLWTLAEYLDKRLDEQAAVKVPICVSRDPLGILSLCTFCSGEPKGAKERELGSPMWRKEFLGYRVKPKTKMMPRDAHSVLMSFFDSDLNELRNSLMVTEMSHLGTAVDVKAKLKLSWVPGY